jgi:hypothetical protein
MRGFGNHVFMLESQKFRERYTGTIVRTVLVSLLLLSTTSCSLLTPNATIYYRSPEVSGIMVDADSGQPVGGVDINVTWVVSHRTENEHSPESLTLHEENVISDTNGVFAIPAWGPVPASRKWHYFGEDPVVGFSKPGYIKSYQVNNNGNLYIMQNTWPGGTFTYVKPTWNGHNIPIHKDSFKTTSP